MARLGYSADMYKALILAASATLLLSQAQPQPKALPLDQIKLPPGFSIAVYATGVPSARSLALGAKGTLFVGSRKGEVYGVVDRDGDNKAERVFTIATGLSTPQG